MHNRSSGAVELQENPQSAQPCLHGRSTAISAVQTSFEVYPREGRLDLDLAVRSGRLVQREALGIPFISVTPDMLKRPRHDEIRAWLKKHPQVTRFVVIDDEDDGLDDLPLFQPSATTGLTGEIVRSVVQYLDGKTDKDMRSSRVERLLQNVQSAIKGHPG